MQIVIELSDETYKAIKEENGIYGINNGLSARITGKVVGAIQSGVPLPKGHGQLKDFDKIEWYGCDLEGRGCIEAKGDCSVCDHANCYAKQVRELPTVIKADKESEVKE